MKISMIIIKINNFQSIGTNTYFSQFFKLSQNSYCNLNILWILKVEEQGLRVTN